ncbi:ribonuclease D [Mangrovicoccus algicola]|uniref:Ribonuclease D n=1 Tax=Mangrovicoccus algicola TaxID=2771008 RepID=A0A8J7CJT1_9RHOB|nr:ribonuclease D [Mangrovicoccus algicola]MBE3637831.1 ribonuclease D [Mangrovicoccus algicola]
MKTLTTTEELRDFCDRAARHPYVTVDTEFLRERTYYSKLCLLQIAYPGEEEDSAVLIDPLAEGIDLSPVYDLCRNTDVVKVFHAARQDVEIFYHDGGVIPEPLFDTQVAAMVCGFGEQVGYETLVKRIARASLDKSSRFTDWSRRPLTDAQKAYALADVTHLRVIYEYLSAELEKAGRKGWVEEEIQVLTDPETYISRPEEAWKRVKTRTNSGKFLGVVAALAEFRERFAQERNIPRSRVFKDDALVELASTKPRSPADLSRSRLLLREARKGEIADGILAAVEAGMNAPADAIPRKPEPDRSPASQALSELLRVLLKAKAESAGVAQKLVATTSELDAIAAGERDLPALKGWRRSVFGEDALRLCEGRIALSARGGEIAIVEL